MSEVQKILLRFEKNAVDAWKENISDVAIVRKLRPNRTEAEQALYDLLMEKMPDVKDAENSMTNDIYNLGYNEAVSEMVSTLNGLFGRTE